MLIDKRKGHARAVHLTKGDFEALFQEIQSLPMSKTPVAMSFAPGVENRSRLYVFTASDELCFVEAHATKPNFWHGPSKHLCQRLTDINVEVLVSASATKVIGDTYLQRILETVGKPLTAEHIPY